MDPTERTRAVYVTQEEQVCVILQIKLSNIPGNNSNTIGSQPVDYPDWCEVVRKPDSCTSIAVMKANNKLPCLWGRGRLRPAAAKTWTSENDPFF
ncbi:hypothetical protein N1851_012457 [Merluccius polli]|uniref:Uncharacterized protein n=1 Tax=Merluccius polli TaxID=89951 RepID=A0AA47P502_MERPO|nr:hypothetical protein N1851_012457 [Merluccius polli]